MDKPEVKRIPRNDTTIGSKMVVKIFQTLCNYIENNILQVTLSIRGREVASSNIAIPTISINKLWFILQPIFTPKA